MAANNRDPDLDAFDKLLASKKSGQEKDKKLRDHYVGVLNERNKLKEQVAVVKEEGFVLVLGDEDLRQQITELKEQIRLLQIATETYQDDFEEERKARAAAAGERERLKLANKKLENENKRLKKEKRDLDTARKEQMGGGSLDGGNPACQSCTQLRKEVQDLKGQEKFLMSELDNAQLKLVDYDSLRTHEKEKDQQIHQLKQQLSQSGIQQMHAGDNQGSNNAWSIHAKGQVHLPQSVGNGRMSQNSAAADPQYPRQPQHIQHTGPHAATFSRGSQLTVGSYHDNQEPILRAKDPLAHSNSVPVGVPLSQLCGHHYFPSSSPHHDVTQSCGPAFGSSARVEDLETSGYWGSNTQDSSRQSPLFQQSSTSQPQLPFSRDDHTHHAFYDNTNVQLVRSAPMAGRMSPRTPSPNQHSSPPPHSETDYHPEVLASPHDRANSNMAGRVSPHAQTSRTPPIPPRAPIGTKPRAFSVDSYSQSQLTDKPLYSNDPQMSLQASSRQLSNLPLNTRDLSHQRSPGHSPVYGNIDNPHLNETQQPVYFNVSRAEGAHVSQQPHEVHDSARQWQEHPLHPAQRQSPPEVPPRESRPSPPPRQPIGASRQYPNSPVPELPPKIESHGHSSGMRTPSQPGQRGYQPPDRSETPPTLSPKPAMYANASQLADYMPSELRVMDDPNTPSRPPRRTDRPQHLASVGSSGVDGRRPNEQLDTNLFCSVCHQRFGDMDTQMYRTHVRQCMGMREHRLREWNERVGGNTESFSRNIYSNPDAQPSHPSRRQDGSSVLTSYDNAPRPQPRKR